MSVSSPATPFQQLSRKGIRYEVRIGDVDGGWPGPDDVGHGLYPITASRVAGGSRDDVLTVGFLFPAQIRDTDLKRYLGRQVEVWAFDDDGEPTILVTWGFVCRKPLLVDAQQEIYTIEARIGDEHFEDRLEKYPTVVLLPVDEDPTELEVMRPLYFNPEIDGIIEGNKSDFPNINPDREWSYIVDPESVRTSAARNLQALQTASKWKLSEAVHAICWWLNSGQTYITNPSLKDVKSAFKARDELLKNVYIPIGTSLPAALDLLLTPLEYGWFLTHGQDADELRESKITFYQRGAGPSKTVFLQADGVKDIRQTNMLSLDAMVSNADLANRVICYGEYKKREATFRLYPAWETKYDRTRSMEMKEGSAFSIAHPEVGRKFVFNEAGDYKGMRDEFASTPDMFSLFNERILEVRRRFLRCLTQHEDADDTESNGYRVDWWNRNLPGADSPSDHDDKGWAKIKWPFSVLEKEMGIWFDGETPPMQLASLMYAGKVDEIYVRITATVMGDSRVKGDAKRRNSSSNKLDMILALDLSDKFQDQRVFKGGDFLSQTDTDIYSSSIFANSPTDARNDTAAIQSYAEQIRNVEDALRLDMTVPLEGGLHPEYEIGDMIPAVGARNLSLKQSETRMPQVVGIVHHFQEQSVELLVESFRKERPRIVHGQMEETGTEFARRADAQRQQLAQKPGPNLSRVHPLKRVL